jgi:hypothetical protein
MRGGCVALKPDDALEAARNIWAGPRIFEAERLNYIAAAVNPAARLLGVPELNQPVTASGWGIRRWRCRRRPAGDEEPGVEVAHQLPAADPRHLLPGDEGRRVHRHQRRPVTAWSHWQANGMDARQTGIHRAAMQYGAVLRDDPARRHGPGDPRLLAAPDDRDLPGPGRSTTGRSWPSTSTARWCGSSTRSASTHRRSRTTRAPAWAPRGFHPRRHAVGVHREAHPRPGFCPVVRYRDRMLLDGEEQFGIVEPLIDIQRRIDETSSRCRSRSITQAFKMRYVIGWIPQSEQEALKASWATSWRSRTTDVKVGQLGGAT